MLRLTLLLALTSVHCVCLGALPDDQLKLRIVANVTDDGGGIRKALSWLPGVKVRKPFDWHLVPKGEREVTVAVGEGEELLVLTKAERVLPTRWGRHDASGSFPAPVSFQTAEMRFEIRVEAVRAEDGTLAVLGSYTICDLAGYEKSHVRLEGAPKKGTNVMLPVVATLVGRFQFTPEVGRPFVLPVRSLGDRMPLRVEFAVPGNEPPGT